MSIVRTATGLDLSLTDGTSTISISDNSVPNADFFTFNTVTFGYYNRNTAHFLDVDNITITYSPIPEPGTYAAIFGLLALAFCLRQRRRNS
ncbi:MAG: PEP-CTERM sorting domain-containing protein [Verrucomicrobia bacterium]|nr:PEP-CTERM sorting domain-containing protein [Verrucomicrobiota bacterium]